MDPSDAGEPRLEGLYGRSREHAILRGQLADTRAGERRLVLVSGHPGIGKSRLLRAVGDDADDLGFGVHVARCWEGGGAPPLHPWLEVVDSLARRERQPPEEAPGEGARVLGALAGDAEGAAPDGDRFALLEAVAAFVERRAAHRPLLLVLDDLHATDSASLTVLRFLARSSAPAPILLLAGYRDSDIARDVTLAATFAELRRGAVHLPLGGLGAEDIAAWIRSEVGSIPAEALVAEIHDRTRGNPLFVAGLLRTLRASGGIGEGIMPSSVLPVEVAGAIRNWIAPLSPETVRTLEAAAVLGREFSVPMLASVQGRPEDAIRSALREAARAGILVSFAAAPDGAQFAHDLFREELERHLAPTERKRLHRAAAASLVAEPRTDERLAALARHRVASADGATAGEAVELSAQAARICAAKGAHLEAAAHAARAVALAREYRAVAERRVGELLLEAGRSYVLAGRLPEARGHLREAIEVAEHLDHVDLLCSSALAFAGSIPLGLDDPEGAALLERTLARAPTEDSPMRVELLCAVASARYMKELTEWQTLVEEAWAIADRLGDPRLLVHAGQVRLLAARYSHDWTAEEHAAHMLEPLVDGCGDDDRAAMARILLAGSALARRDLASLRRTWRAIDEIALGSKRALWRYTSAVFQAQRAMAAGDFQSARGRIYDAYAIGQWIDPVAHVVFTCQLLCLVRDVGWSDEDRRWVEDGLEFLQRSFRSAAHVPVFVAAARLALGDRAGCRRIFEELAADRFRAAAAERASWSFTGALLCEQCFELEEPRAADDLLALMAPFEDRIIHPGYGPYGCFGAAERYLGLAAAAAERFDDAERWLRRALDVHRELRVLPLVAKSEIDLARMLERRGRVEDRSHALELLDPAESTAERLGMEPLLPTIGRLRARLSGDSVQVADVVVQPSGGGFEVRHGVRRVTLRDSKGLRYLARLLEHPGESVHVLELSGTRGPGDDAAAAIEKARKAVKNRIDQTLRRLEDVLPDAANILRRSIRTGIRCRVVSSSGPPARAIPAPSTTSRPRLR